MRVPQSSRLGGLLGIEPVHCIMMMPLYLLNWPTEGYSQVVNLSRVSSLLAEHPGLAPPDLRYGC
jgi:hypothetical protein